MVLGDGFILWRLFLSNQSSSALNPALMALRKRGDWPTIEAVKGCVLVLVGGCLRRVGRCVLGGCWVWCRDGFLELVRGFCGDWDRECAEWVEKA